MNVVNFMKVFGLEVEFIPFAANLIIEAHSDFVKILYNGIEMKLNGC